MNELGTGAAPSPPPTDYQLILPDGWFRIRLNAEEREASIDALIDRQFKGIDDAPHIKQDLRKDLLHRANKAYDKGGIELYLSLQAVGPITIPASLLVSLAPLAHAEALLPAELAQSLLEDSNGDQEIGHGMLKSGPAVRVRGRTEPSKKDAANGYPTAMSLDYYLPIPESFAYLLLSFSTPLEPIADAMAELFDSVADSLTWVG